MANAQLIIIGGHVLGDGEIGGITVNVTGGAQAFTIPYDVESEFFVTEVRKSLQAREG